MAGRTSEAEQILEEMSALDEKHRPEGLRAILYQILGDPEAANDCMEASIAAREPGLWMVGRNPFGDPLRANPRYPIWMDRIGVPYFKADP
jgi:hypothetical protein